MTKRQFLLTLCVAGASLTSELAAQAKRPDACRRTSVTTCARSTELRAISVPTRTG